ncbi:SPOR domain-containing protein [Erythrobacter litoralis]|uniref:SPOR domain-containing protein n=1 Tax=Erythrobacter litoralis (strain HTCC2594) TaxID=314225 RepID=Q2NCY3_ERYLH|nr:SPOR domain-containing protein [Erythrobacter litoralis]ABC62458.1 hypothetical protein ELI_01830 [Erythrobacter litoralis HTCC2594]
MPIYRSILCASGALAALTIPLAAVSAQDTSGGRAVVQALPSAASEELRTALRQLARNSRDLNALIAAGTASLELGDVEAAVGFFGRADELAPGDPRVKAGKAAAYVRTERPVEALRLFEEAEGEGVEIVRLAGDYGLAYDLVGNNRAAQAAYRRVLARAPSDEVSRRLALSLAIDGNADAFEETLRPLLAQRDFAAYRTRAFGLAILGRADDAVAIAEAVMPRTMSRKIEPYLRYMPRLTRAQQAAAANLGIYPRAAQIGRDDPRIAGLSPPTTAAPQRTADAVLAPSGPPLGQAEAEAAQPAPSRREARRLARAAQRESASDPLTRTRERPRVVRAAPSAQQSAPDAAAPGGQTAIAAADPAPAPAMEVPQPAAQIAQAPEQAAPLEPAPAREEPVVVARMDDPATSPGFDLANVGGSTAASAAASSGSNPLGARTAATQPPVPSGRPASLADAFSDFSAPLIPQAEPAAGAVDITAITAPREVEAPPEPAKPTHSSRFWVQVATGRDRAALRFDWRRLSRAADGLLDGKGPFVTPWGQTNRLLAGPYDSRDAARKALNGLQEKDLDAFTFTSPEGQEVEPLG